MHELCMAAIAGDVHRASEIHMKLLPLHKQLFCEPNPIPVKWALQRLGRCGGALRLPLTTLSSPQQPLVEQALRDGGAL
jgi:4-hydroxy-tetrahydrodipicolinate synthase